MQLLIDGDTYELNRQTFSRKLQGWTPSIAFSSSRALPAGVANSQPVNEPVVTSPEAAAAAFEMLGEFLRSAPFTRSINQLEHDLENANSSTAARLTSAAGLSEALLSAALRLFDPGRPIAGRYEITRKDGNPYVIGILDPI